MFEEFRATEYGVAESRTFEHGALWERHAH
jgi:hypothetical protein